MSFSLYYSILVIIREESTFLFVHYCFVFILSLSLILFIIVSSVRFYFLIYFCIFQYSDGLTIFIGLYLLGIFQVRASSVQPKCIILEIVNTFCIFLATTPRSNGFFFVSTVIWKCKTTHDKTFNLSPVTEIAVSPNGTFDQTRINQFRI